MSLPRKTKTKHWKDDHALTEAENPSDTGTSKPLLTWCNYYYCQSLHTHDRVFHTTWPRHIMLNFYLVSSAGKVTEFVEDPPSPWSWGGVEPRVSSIMKLAKHRRDGKFYKLWDQSRHIMWIATVKTRNTLTIYIHPPWRETIAIHLAITTAFYLPPMGRESCARYEIWNLWAEIDRAIGW